MNTPDPKHIVMSHRMTNITAVVCADGSAGLCGITQAINPDGVELVGNGTCPRPLGVKLTGAYAVAPQLAIALKDALERLEHVDRALLERTGSRFDCEVGEVVRGRKLLEQMQTAVVEPMTEKINKPLRHPALASA